MVLLSKIISYIFALVVIFVTGNIIFSIVIEQTNISNADMLLIFCMLMIMLMGIYYIGNDIRNMRSNPEDLRKTKEDGVLDEDLL